jgi:2-hydroxychromene-2-carboxylate isomerase
MAHTLEFFWDFSSPFAYLAATQVDALAARTGATLRDCPMLLGAVFKAIGTDEVPLFRWPEAKRRYILQDVQRWADHWNVPFRFPTRFPVMSLRALRAFLLLPDDARAAFRRAAFRATWADDRDLGDDATLGELLGPHAAEVLPRLSSPAAKEALFASTQRALDAGVFGAPSFRVDGEHLFWGQDRLPLVETALRSAAPANDG